jgi:hypothetical protein
MTFRISWILAIPVLLSLSSYSTAFAQAETTVKCGDGSKATVSTGTNSGTCSFTGVKWVTCSDSGGNVVSAGGCTSGTAACGDSSGAGKCNLAALPPGTATGRKPISSGAITAKPGTMKSSGSQLQGKTGLTTSPTTTVNPALTNPGLLGSGGGTGAAATMGSKNKLPTSGTSSQGR